MVSGLFVLTMFVAVPRDLIAQGNQKPLLVTDTDNPDRSPWRAELCIASEFCEAPASLTAPADRNIVIDVFSGECSIDNGGVFRGMQALVDEGILHQFLPEREIVGTTNTIHDWNKQTRMVIPAHGSFRVRVFTVSNLPDLAYCNFYLSGYTVKP